MLSLQHMLDIKYYKTVWMIGQKILKTMSDRDANYRLTGLEELGDSYFRGSEPSMESRGASGKLKVVVSKDGTGGGP